MNCCCDINEYRYGKGLLNEGVLCAYESKKLPEDFLARAREVGSVSAPEAATKAIALYEEIQNLPITAERTQDPTALDTIVEWCPIILSPFDYEVTDAVKGRAAAADAMLRGCENNAVYKLTADFIGRHKEFGVDDVTAWLRANPQALSCAQKIALENLDGGIAPERASCYANPCRADCDALAIGAAFGLAFPGQPDVAAKKAMTYAWTGYYKGGIYSAMWMASLLSHAAVISDPEVFVVRALNTVPIPSQYFRSVAWMQRNLNCGVCAEDCKQELHRMSPPQEPFNVRSCFANSCAVAASLLYSAGDNSAALAAIADYGYDVSRNIGYVKAVTMLR